MATSYGSSVLAGTTDEIGRLRSALDQVSDAWALLAAVRDDTGAVVDFRFADANAATCELLGLDRGRLIGRGLLDALPRDAGAALVDAYRRVVETGEPVTVTDWAWPDGEPDAARRMLDIRAVPSGDAVSQTWRDVTERVDALGSLARARHASDVLLEAELEPHVLASAIRDQDGRIVDFRYEQVNPAACAYLGLPRERLAGARFLELMPGLVESGLFARYVDVVETGRSLVLDNLEFANEVLGATRFYDLRAVKIGDGLSLTVRDMTERIEQARRLATSEERYRLLAEYSSDVIFEADLEGVITWASPSAERTLGWLPAQLVGTHALDLVHPDDRDWFEGELHRAVRAGQAVDTTVRVRRADGSDLWINAAGRAVPAIGNRPAFRIVRFRDVQDEVASRRELEVRARTDALTGLLTRAEGWKRLGAALAHRPRTGDKVAALFCDLDGFKAVNDARGHLVGDRLLIEISRRLRAAVREEDFVVRLGGDEFLVVLNGVHDIGEALRIADKARVDVARPILVDGDEVSITASVGTTLARSEEAVEALVARTDAAMYDAKRSGKNQVVPIP